MHVKHALAVLAAVLVTGCSGLTTDAGSEQARVTLTGETPVDIRIITSTRFGFFVDQDTGERQTLLEQADTLDLRPPFDETYDISQFGIFLVRIIGANETPATFGIRISIDGETKFDVTEFTIGADTAGTPGSYEWSWVS